MRERNYIVVFKAGEHFVSPRNREEAAGWAPDMIWIFGEPKTDEEFELRLTIQAAAIIKEAPISVFGQDGQLRFTRHTRGNGK